MVAVDGVEELFERDYVRLVRSLSVAFDAESAADAVQEAFIAADRRWARVGAYDDPAGWVRRVAVNRLLNGRRNRGRRAESTEPPVGGRAQGRVVAAGAASLPGLSISTWGSDGLTI
jgi:RNA polymerase sigma-70 factor (ECF subfamily)